MNKITVKLPKPRNPLVAPCRMRKAGAHRSGSSRSGASGRWQRELAQAMAERQSP